MRFFEKDLIKKLEEKIIPLESSVWFQGMSSWKPIIEIAEFRPYFFPEEVKEEEDDEVDEEEDTKEYIFNHHYSNQDNINRQTIYRIQYNEYKFCWCPAGSFMMGSPMNESGRMQNEYRHEVYITKAFALLETPVTQKLWESVMGNNPSANFGSNYPVERINWFDCKSFIDRLNQLDILARDYVFGFPSEAQWEYACRAGSNATFNFGDTLNGMNANCNGNFPYGTNQKGPFLNRTTEVKQYIPNSWGFYDMHGNVNEWCQDWFAENYYTISPLKDPTGIPNGGERVNRGGGFTSFAWFCRSANRIRKEPFFRSNSLGFRIAIINRY